MILQTDLLMEILVINLLVLTPRISLTPVPGLQDSTRTNGNEVDPLGAHAKEAAALISKLAQIGLDSLDIPLPKCVVLGTYQMLSATILEPN
jgi:hypothetical protein